MNGDIGSIISELQQAICAQTSRLHRVALRIVGNSSDADDVVQEACLQAIRNQDQIRNDGKYVSWLHRITVNCGIDFLRKNKRSDNMKEPLSHQINDFYDNRQDPPEQLVEQKELFHMAVRFVEELPNDCRMSFILTQMDGYTYLEVSEILNVPRGTVASRVCRAKKLLLSQMNATEISKGEEV